MSNVHVDDWLDTPYMGKDPGETFARYYLEFQRFPAWKKCLYSKYVDQYSLYCTYEGARYKVTGASRMGDIWLSKDLKRQTGYDLRVFVNQCSDWGRDP